MVLESTVVCVDISEYMRNGDFAPSRMKAQEDAVAIVCQSKTRRHPENNVALMTMVGPEVLTSLTTDVGRLLYRLAQLQPKGEIDFLATVRVAHLILKNRENKSHKMRMVIFVGSPVITSAKELSQVACHLKKEQVNVDIVNFGEYAENMGKLSSFISILNGDGTGSSHMVTVPAGNILSKVVAGTAIVQGEDSRSAINFNLDFHDDDPAFLLALRVSLEEQRFRHCQDYEARQEMAVSSTDSTPAASGAQSLEQPLYVETEPDDFGAVGGFTDYRTMTYDELVAYAMVMCLQNQAVPEHIASLLPDDLPEEDALDTDEAEQITEEDTDDDVYDDIFLDDMFQDPAFVMSILESFPDADTQSAPAVVTDADQVNKPADQDEDVKDEPSEGN
ncbi:hypothetical protein MTO96_013401 [Rhipicephalus appendiculatus]